MADVQEDKDHRKAHYDSLVLDPVDSILGKYGSIIHEHRDTYNLVSASLLRESSCIRLCGTRKAAQDVRAVFVAYLMCLPVLKLLGRDQDNVKLLVRSVQLSCGLRASLPRETRQLQKLFVKY